MDLPKGSLSLICPRFILFTTCRNLLREKPKLHLNFVPKTTQNISFTRFHPLHPAHSPCSNAVLTHKKAVNCSKSCWFFRLLPQLCLYSQDKSLYVKNGTFFSPFNFSQTQVSDHTNRFESVEKFGGVAESPFTPPMFSGYYKLTYGQNALVSGNYPIVCISPIPNVPFALSTPTPPRSQKKIGSRLKTERTSVRE